MVAPNPYLPPPSQPWGRWVVDNIQRLVSEANVFRRETSNNLRQLNVALLNPMRGAIWRQTTGTVTITTTGVYVPMNLAGTLDDTASFNMELSTAPNVTGLKNTTNQARTMVIIATYDGKGGNNEIVGLRLAINNVQIPETECRSFGGSSGQVAKTLTQWILRLEPGDEVSMFAANHSSTVNLTIERFKMIAHAII
jgi:hypothetical protein